MPTVHRGHKTLVHYPDGTSKVITLYVRPLEGQIIAHGWEVTNVAPGEQRRRWSPDRVPDLGRTPGERRASGDARFAFIVTRSHCVAAQGVPELEGDHQRHPGSVTSSTSMGPIRVWG